MRLIITALLFFASNLSYAFDVDKCMDWMLASKGTDWEKAQRGLFSTSTVPTSSFQFTSSSGECNSLSLEEKKRAEFFVNNYEPLIDNIASGAGAYLDTLISLSDSKSSDSKAVKKRLQNNLQDIFGKGLERKPQDAYKKITKYLN